MKYYYYKYHYVLLLLVSLNSLLKFRVEEKKLGHIFILRSFYYPQSSLYANSPTDTIVTLFNMVTETQDEVQMTATAGHCLTGAFIAQPKPGTLKALYATLPSQCLIRVYRMVCFPAKGVTNFAVSFNRTAPIKFELSEPQTKKREVVVCPGRMFVFDQWHLFLTAMELHRIHRVDLVVVYIQSVHSVVYDLIKLYEAEDFVMIRTSLLMPFHLNTLTFNPNEETLLNNQLFNFQECLYEFRESASFIAFPDWDDLIITPDSLPLPSMMSELSELYPKSCSFIVNRYLGAMESLGKMSRHHYSLSHLWQDGISFTKDDHEKNTVQKMGKAIVRPECVHVVGFHEALPVRGHDQNEIPMHSMYIVHARNNWYHDLELTSKLDEADMMIVNFRSFQQRHPEFQERLLPALPKRDSALEKFNECLGPGSLRLLQLTNESNTTKCTSYGLCGLYTIKLAGGTCMNTKNEWSTRIIGDMSISTLDSRSFVQKADCIV